MCVCYLYISVAYPKYMNGVRDAVICEIMNEMIELTQEELKLIHGLIRMRLKSLRMED